MGTDAQCRDYFIRVVYGTRVSLSVGLFASVLVLIIGLLYGSISGYLGGRVDLIMMRIVDIIYSLPDMLVIILLSVVLNETLKPLLEGTILQSLGVNMISLFIVYGLLYWVGMSRLVRGQILTIKNNEYVLAAKATGRKKRQNYLEAHYSELYQRYYYLYSIANSFCHFYRELFKLYRTWCSGADAFTGKPCKYSKRRASKLSIQAYLPGNCYLFDCAFFEPSR